MNDDELLDIYGVNLAIKYLPINNNELELFSTKYSSAYGEISYNGLNTILKNINTDNKIFYDLGSGNGTLVIRAVLLYNFKKVVGVELSGIRHNYAVKLKNQINKNDKKNKIYLLNNDIFSIDIKEADIIYISNLCFSNRINRELGLKIRDSVKDNTIIFSSKEIPFINQNNKTLINLSQSWNDNCYVYKYII